VPTHEELGIAFAKNNQPLRAAVDGTLDAVKRNGTFACAAGALVSGSITGKIIEVDHAAGIQILHWDG
jgi:ABC-type amino acid transport substrate-binding protein